MRKKSNLFRPLLLIVLIPLSTTSFGQTEDTCFTKTEVRKLATLLLQKQENDRFLDLTARQLKVKSEIVVDQDNQIILLKKSSVDQQVIIGNKDAQIQDLNGLLKREHRRKNWIKVGWVGTTIAFVGLIILTNIR